MFANLLFTASVCFCLMTIAALLNHLGELVAFLALDAVLFSAAGIFVQRLPQQSTGPNKAMKKPASGA
ncbi:hypothetical protein COY28_03535 [Candidatus Woesearchaeota archaeon CG_4_10_14_0_2_um_filter_57_5]|nr:MAG: hypothetical protein AUJ68_03425 [Candidatus Woesearchaeota archaeon CG1_02_57_44]PIN70865.1 MAG: hypothetical protein COV94_00865 [Candidatus Woesearchaeota archaeon CG11_big_fil_rev_8_21_14_0_20_57_5]PIZ53485.1 MAG: hypothetical protein COY28_03535 [Candidatus Woesearchaeota archaeon CG_4_10_14_0_2_um_filter_57_5]